MDSRNKRLYLSQYDEHHKKDAEQKKHRKRNKKKDKCSDEDGDEKQEVGNPDGKKEWEKTEEWENENLEGIP